MGLQERAIELQNEIRAINITYEANKEYINLWGNNATKVAEVKYRENINIGFTEDLKKNLPN